MKIKRKIEMAVISDVHLGSYSCQAKSLLDYLNSIEPKKLILNGDILDVWQFDKQYFPKSHLKIIKKLMNMASHGVEIIYITGDHDEIYRKFSGYNIGNISIVNKLVLNLHGKKAWFFHGDVFDVAIQNAKWLAKLGCFGYNALFLLNRGINWCLKFYGKDRYSLSKKRQKNLKSTAKCIKNFEKVVSDLAIENGCDYVVCGHIHHPKMAYIETTKGKTVYLNSGDWVENFTALEYQFKRWKLYHYNKDKLAPFYLDDDLDAVDVDHLIAAITILQQRKKRK